MLKAMGEGEQPMLGEAQAAPVNGIGAKRWYAVAVLFLINCFAFTDRIGLSVLLELIKHDLHLTDAQLGLVAGLAFALFNVILVLPLAWVADRYSRVKLISVSLLLWTAMTAISGFARNFTELFIARAGVGVGEAGSHPSSLSLIGDYFPRESRALGVGLFNAGAVAGVAGGMAAIGLLGEKYGWRTSLQLIGVMGIPLAILAYFTLPEPARPPLHREQGESLWATVRALVKRAAFRNVSLGISIAFIGSSGFSVWAPTFLIRSFHMNVGAAGAWIGGITAGCGIIGAIVGGLLMLRLMPRDPRWELWLPAAAVAACVPTFVLMILTDHVWVVLAMKGVNTFFGACAASASSAALQTFAEPRRRATAVAITLVLTSLLGSGVGPYLIGVASMALEPMLGQESLRYALLMAPVMMVWAVVHYLLAAQSALKDRVN
jgi:MFS family permease